MTFDALSHEPRANALYAGVDPLLDERSPHGPRALGIHPLHIGDADAQLQGLTERLCEVVAIGECGLDARGKGAEQERVFAAQLRLASTHNLPVIVHSVRRTQRTLALLAAHEVRGFVHGFSGAPEVARDYVALGLYVSFGRQVLLARSKRARASVLVVPEDRILVETDGFGGIDAVVHEVAALRQISPSVFSRQADTNARSLGLIP